MIEGCDLGKVYWTHRQTASCLLAGDVKELIFNFLKIEKHSFEYDMKNVCNTLCSQVYHTDDLIARHQLNEYHH